MKKKFQRGKADVFLRRLRLSFDSWSFVVPSIVWANMASDKESDSDVSSDLCYATLDTATPFNKQTYDFDSCLKVGRLPNIDFKKYFENLRDFCGKAGDVKTFGETAESFVYSNHKDLIGVKPRFYKYSEFNSEIDAVFTKKNEIGVKIVSLSVTPSAQIRQMLESK